MKTRVLPLAVALTALLSTSTAFADVLLPDGGGPDTDSGSSASADGGTATDGGAAAAKSSSSGGCSVAGNDTGLLGALMPLGLAALVPLALRRKRR